MASIVKKLSFSTKEIKWGGLNWSGDNPFVQPDNSSAIKYGWNPVYNTSEKAIIRACEEML